MQNREEPGGNLPLLPPPEELETRAVLKALVGARTALAQLDATATWLANPTVVINAIPLLEARASSEIENIVTTTDELFAADALGNIDSGNSPAVRETLRYRGALRTGFDSLQSRPLTTNTALLVCSEIRGHEVAVRSGEVYIGNPATRQRIYTPPIGVGTIADLLSNWDQFVNNETQDDLDPLTRMAVVHYQFEAIHPFSDGNGRTGRILGVLMLCAAGLLQQPLLYLSQEINATKDEYYRRLLSVTREGDWEGWILYLLEQVRSSGVRTLALVNALTELRESLMVTIRETTGTANVDLADVLTEQPYVRARDVVSRCAVSRPTATKWLKALVEAGALEEVRAGRETLYLNFPMLKVLSGDSTDV